jgi:lactose/L-arabinose transport system ATP-binding protein
MRLEIAALHERLGATMIYVTHDQVEAMTLADKIVVLRAGEVAQVGSPIDLYGNPDNTFVAGFIGSPKMNMVEGRVEAVDGLTAVVSVPTFGTGTLRAKLRSRTPGPGDSVTLGIRPEYITLGEGFPGRVRAVEQLGSVSFLYAEMPGGAQVTIEQRRLSELKSGAPITIQPEAGELILFDKDGQRL